MLGALVRKELLMNLLTLRLAVALAFTVALAVMTALVGSAEYSRNWDRFEQRRQGADEELARATVWGDVEPQIFLPPRPLSILCRGLSEGAGRTWRVDLDFRDLVFQPVTGADSDLMQSLVRADFATVVALLLSFLAVVLGHDGICGERERGTLQLLLANAVPRTAIVLGKLVGGLLSLWLPLALAFAAALLILLANPDVQLQGSDWARLALFLALSCLFLGQMFTFSLAVSACTRETATSLIVCLFFWLVAGIGWANVLPALARYGADEPPFQDFLDQNRQLAMEHGDLEREYDDRHPPPPDLYFSGRRESPVRYQHPQAYAWQAARNAYLIPERLEAEERRHRLWQANQMPLARQGLLIDAWGALSPLVNFQVLSYQLAGTTLADNLHAGQAAHRYRATFYDWLRARGAFGDRRWFTDDPPEQEPMVADPEAVADADRQPDSAFMAARRAWMAEQERRAAADDGRHLDLTDLPRFGDPRVDYSLGEACARMGPGLGCLLGTTAACAALLLWRFARYEPGR